MFYRTGAAWTDRKRCISGSGYRWYDEKHYQYGVTVRRREDLGKIIKMAFYIAQTGKPGPVLIDIPKDIQTASGSAEYPSHVDIRGISRFTGYISDS